MVIVGALCLLPPGLGNGGTPLGSVIFVAQENYWAPIVRIRVVSAHPVAQRLFGYIVGK